MCITNLKKKKVDYFIGDTEQDSQTPGLYNSREDLEKVINESMDKQK